MKKILLFILVAFLANGVNAQNEFITRWDLSYAGSSTNSITFGVVTTGTVNYTWETIPAGTTGGGSFSGSAATITGLPINSVIRLKIDSSYFSYFKMNNGIDKNRLIDLENWGNISWVSMNSAFYGCSNLNISATDMPNLNNVTDMELCFALCSQLNTPSNINSWNVSNVNKMGSMFWDATLFNQPIGNWNVSNVTQMLNMFYNATSFNQPIGNWNTSNVVYMYDMFFNATSFSQSIGNWNVSNVTSMIYMFYNATSFNQSLSNWNLNSSVNLSNLFNNSGMDCNNYSTTLNGWANNPNIPSGRSLGAGGLNYGTNAITSRNYLINTKGWTISGDSPSGQTCCSVTSSTQNQTTCNSYTFNNQIFTTSGIYYDTLINSTGCDSIITLNLTINSNSSTLNQITCNSYTFNNQIHTTSGIYYDTLINSNGCDSIITLNLTINNPTSNTINQTSCNSYNFNNQANTTTGIYYDTLINSTGCDSIITLNLTINNPNIATTQNGTQLSSAATGATYQWLKCNPYSVISGATNQTYTATANGDYAVAVTQNGCTDTSNCMAVNSVGLNNYSVNHLITISPNPANSIFEIKGANNGAVVNLYNTFGQKLLTSKIENQTALINISNFANGVYVAEIIEGNQTSRIKISKQ